MKKRSRELRAVHAIVPVNVLSKSKVRLSPILSPNERQELSVAMLKDVLSALRKARQIRQITIVSADKSARVIARRFGTAFLWEGKRRGLNKGIKLAVRSAGRKGAVGVLVIHADLPLLKAREIDRFVERSRGYSVALTPSKDGSGTNALLMNPPEVFKPVFGTDSFRRHLYLAHQRNLRIRVLRFNGVGFDIDQPQDLVQLARRPLRNETGRFLRTLRKGVRSRGGNTSKGI